MSRHTNGKSMIFQRYALFPHLNVFENVAFGLRVNKVPKNQIEPAVTEMPACRTEGV